jgi:osmotically-inducible protein OsmY
LVPAERLKVRVAEGWVTVKGEVDWERQTEAAMDAVRSLRGAVGVTDMVTVRLRESVATEDLKARIGQTSQRVAELDAGRPGVEVDGDRVVLPGTVRSWAEREEAERQARAAPGVREVANQLSVQGIVPVNC